MSFNFNSKKKVLWNPTPFRIDMVFENVRGSLEPFSEIETTDDVFVRCMLYDHAEVGLVALDEAEMGDKDFVKYKAEKEIEGLKRILSYKEERVRLEQEHVQGKKTKTNVDAASIPNNISKFLKEVKAVESILNDLAVAYQEYVPEEVIPTRPEWKQKPDAKVIPTKVKPKDKKDGIKELLGD